MLLSVKNKALLAVLALLAVSACAEYQNHWDTVSLRAGNAPEANLAVQAVDPFPPNAGRTQIDTPGDNL